jgi:hypothetical protein
MIELQARVYVETTLNFLALAAKLRFASSLGAPRSHVLL